MNLLPKSLFSLAVACSLASIPLRADVNSDLAFSNFSNIDLNALAGGTVLQARAGLIYFQRGILTQSLYVVDTTPADVASKLVHWNPVNHSELKVWAHKSLPANPKPADFSDLADLPDNSSVKYLLTATEKFNPGSTTLQVSKDEAQLLVAAAAQGGDAKTRFASVWSQIMAQRFSSFLSGRAASDSYTVNGSEMHPISEIKDLIHSDPKVYAEFQRLFNQTPIRAGAGSKSLPGNLYWQSFDVEGAGALVDGAMYQASSGNSIMSADLDFYINSGVFATVELEQIWPVTINGKTETLVWRDDLVSAPSIQYLHGTERLASGMIMLQDVKQDIDAFRSEFR